MSKEKKRKKTMNKANNSKLYYSNYGWQKGSELTCIVEDWIIDIF